MTHPHPYMMTEGSAQEIAFRQMTSVSMPREEDAGLKAMREASARYGLQTSVQTPEPPKPAQPKQVATASVPKEAQAVVEAEQSTIPAAMAPPPQLTRGFPGGMVGGIVGEIIADVILDGIIPVDLMPHELLPEKRPPKPKPEKPKKPRPPPAGKHKVRRCLLVTRSKKTKADCTKNGKKTIPLEGKPGTTVRPGGATGGGRTAGRVNIPPETPRRPLGDKPKGPVLKPGKIPVPGHDDLRFIWNGRGWNCWSAKTKKFVKCPKGVRKPAKPR